jgi:hypothetical protein
MRESAFFIAIRARRSIAAGVLGTRLAVARRTKMRAISAGAAGCEHGDNLGPFE